MRARCGAAPECRRVIEATGEDHEIGWFIPEPAGGRAAPRTNDVDVDARGLIYIVNRHAGSEVLELASH